jgi:NitT/TauT family transport system ATP-binding protein
MAEERAVLTGLSPSQPSAAAAPLSEPLLVVDDLAKAFRTPEGSLAALEHIAFAVREGEFVSIIGPSGCGKSTLFNIIGGLIDGFQGRVTIAGAPISGPHAAIGMVFQDESTFPWRTVVENVAFPLEIQGMPKPKRLARARHFIALSGSKVSSIVIRSSFPAGCGSGWRSRARSPSSRKSS